MYLNQILRTSAVASLVYGSLRAKQPNYHPAGVGTAGILQSCALPAQFFPNRSEPFILT